MQAAILAVVACIPFVFAGIDPSYATNITLYHVNPPLAGASPVNMDSGDPGGDLLFYLTQFLLPLECSANPPDWRSRFDCTNPEQVGPLVVTKVDLLVDSRFTTYSACNLCNGTDPLSGKKCEKGAYICDACRKPWGSGCDTNMVGKQNAAELFTPGPECGSTLTNLCGKYAGKSQVLCDACLAWNRKELMEKQCNGITLMQYCSPYGAPPCGEGSRDYQCWRENVGRKIPGYWYSTLKDGECQEASPEKSCSWKVVSTSTVREPCMRESVMNMAESASPDCFHACGPRNTTSHCWIKCFFSTLLGAEAESAPRVTGIPEKQIVNSWTRAFLAESEGGCPKIPDLPMHAVPGAHSQLPGWLAHRDLTQVEGVKEQLDTLEESASDSATMFAV